MPPKCSRNTSFWIAKFLQSRSEDLMDDYLPSYTNATHQDPWELVAPYLFAPELLSTALVSRSWHQNFSAQLWGNPLAHFAEDDTVYVVLTRFIKSLPQARSFVRQWTHTLQISPSNDESYGYPPSTWLRDVLDWLPGLQSLVVHGVPFFDHASLLNLRNPSPNSSGYGIRLLDASNCINATSSGLLKALQCLPNLVYLDLSHTPAVKGHSVLLQLGRLRTLRVLKLASLSLKHNDIAILAATVQRGVRSLDLRNNELTDASVRLIRDRCFGVNDDPLVPTAETQDVDLEKHIRTRLAQGHVGSLSVEDQFDGGVTHLYVAGNCITAASAADLLEPGRLHALDVGDLCPPTGPPWIVHSEGAAPDPMSGARRLGELLFGPGSGRLKYLRISHSVVTTDFSRWMSSSRLSPSENRGDPPIYTPSPSSRHHLAIFNSLYSLTLTSIPSHTTDHSIPANLKDLIHSCAASTADHRGAYDPPTLRRITLEVISQPQHPRTRERHTLSSTEDQDTEVFWQAARDDFSFFQDEKVDVDPQLLGGSDGASETSEPLYDVVSEIAQYRRARKAAYEAARRRGIDGTMAGYWPGEVAVVRKTSE
ncbi:hypothetical protein M011DRAFT_9964 [Sporormia fimetaria CBS 119925]|uniref:RNI-like protein n=1 Tax=Sporormia fimetaria CBS 119925 TaxID=1340428 RepID=A0A6A6VQ75_9PLEO|nr:hypothetical protein M011DRAFT_9964 [Sporormia fimetaria CBS 119925]